MKHIFHKIVCAIVGHDWKFLRFGPRYKPQFHTTMHSDCDCVRCGKQVREADRASAG